MQKVLHSELAGRKCRFVGTKHQEKPVVNVKSKTKGDGKGNKTASQGSSAQMQMAMMLEKKEDPKTIQFRDFRDKLADPRFFTPIKSQMQNAANNASAARTGGPIMVDKYMIPAAETEFRWLNENMDAVNSLYDH